MGLLQLPALLRPSISGVPDADLLAEAVFLQFAYLLGAVALFLRYPSTERMAKDIASWLGDPVAIVPIFVQYRFTHYTGPRSIVKPLTVGLAAILVAVFLAEILLMFSPISPTLAALIPYEDAIVLLGFVGMALHRLRTNRAVRSALAEYAAKVRGRPNVRGSQIE
jgi:hypothetical protein